MPSFGVLDVTAPAAVSVSESFRSRYVRKLSFFGGAGGAGAAGPPLPADEDVQSAIPAADAFSLHLEPGLVPRSASDRFLRPRFFLGGESGFFSTATAVASGRVSGRGAGGGGGVEMEADFGGRPGRRLLPNNTAVRRFTPAGVEGVTDDLRAGAAKSSSEGPASPPTVLEDDDTTVIYKH